MPVTRGLGLILRAASPSLTKNRNKVPLSASLSYAAHIATSKFYLEICVNSRHFIFFSDAADLCERSVGP